MRFIAAVLLSVSSALAYQIISPGGSQGWTTTGPNILVWQRVDTDPQNFTVVLTNVVSMPQRTSTCFVDVRYRTVVQCPTVTKSSTPSSMVLLATSHATLPVAGGPLVLGSVSILSRMRHTSTVYLLSPRSSTLTDLRRPRQPHLARLIRKLYFAFITLTHLIPSVPQQCGPDTNCRGLPHRPRHEYQPH